MLSSCSGMKGDYIRRTPNMTLDTWKAQNPVVGYFILQVFNGLYS